MNAPATTLIQLPEQRVEREGNNVRLPAVVDPSGIMAVIAAASRDPNVDVDKMLRLYDLRDRELSRVAEQKYNEAMKNAQGEMRRIATDSTNSQTHSEYASYGAIDRAIRSIYTAHGFGLSFDTGKADLPDHIRILCKVSHADGFVREHHADMPCDGKGAKGGDVMTKTHAAGSAMRYGQRYLVTLIFNLAIGKDDDGNASGPQSDYERVTDSQAADLLALVTEVGANLPALLTWLRRERLADIPAADFSKVVRALEDKRKANAAKAAGAKGVRK